MPDVRILVVGTGPERGNLENLASSLGVREKFIFLGSVPEEAKNATFRAGDIFVFPSITGAEAFGIAQVEAQLCGLPIVTTALPTGVSDVTRDGLTGYCVEPDNPGQLADAINRLLGDAQLRRRLGEAGLARARANYVPNAIRPILFNFYDNVVQCPKPSRSAA